MAVKDDIRKFELEINAASKNGETLAQITKIGKETATLREENVQLEKTLGFLRANGKQNTEEYKRMSKQLNENKKAVKENGIAMKGLQKSLDLTQMSMNQLRQRSRDLKSTLGATSKAANPKEYDKLEKELKQVGDAMTNLKGKGKQTKNTFAQIKEGAKGMLPAFGFSAIVTGIIGITKHLFDLREQTFEYRKQIKGLTGETGPALVGLTAALQATAKTFDQDLEKLAIANHNFAESMGISERQANDLINNGFLAGADASGEFLDRLKEYGPQFKAVGLSAQQSIALMTQEVRQGVFSDKGTDAIKEAGLALREMPQTAREALEGIGISSEEMMEQITSGEKTVFEAIQDVSKKMAELPPQSAEVGTALADIFKGAGEDAGLDYILMLGNVEASMDDLIDKSDEVAISQEKALKSNQNLALAWNLSIGETNTTLTNITSGVKNFAAASLLALRGYLFGVDDMVASIAATIEDTNSDTEEKQKNTLANLNRLTILAQKELNIALAKSIRNRGSEQIEAENQRWEKEKETLEARIITKANLNEQEIALNDILHKLLEEKERYHQEKITDIKVKNAKENALKIEKVSETIKDTEKIEEVDNSDIDRQIKAEIAFQEEKKKAIEKYQRFTLEELQAEEMALLQKAYDDKLITEEIFQQAKLDMEQRFADMQAEEDNRRYQEKIAKYQEYIAIVSMAAQGFSAVVSNLQQAEFTELEGRREAGLVDEEQYEREAIAIKKKYADKQFIAALANIGAATAQGVMQSFAEFGPVLGAILSTIPIAAGASQVAVANKERQRVKQLRRGKYGYNVIGEEDGRSYNVPFTQSLNTGLQRTPTLVAEEPEIVVSTKDTAKVMGHNPLILNAIKSPADYAVIPQRARGNLPNTSETATNSSASDEILIRATAVMEKLANDGIQATAYYGDAETRKIKEQQDTDANILKETSFN